jgi:hypothetical protein
LRPLSISASAPLTFSTLTGLPICRTASEIACSTFLRFHDRCDTQPAKYDAANMMITSKDRRPNRNDDRPVGTADDFVVAHMTLLPRQGFAQLYLVWRTPRIVWVIVGKGA